MMNALIDTGPWVALIDRGEKRHEECVKWFTKFKGIMYSSEAVLTEVLYLLNFSSETQFAALDFVLSGVIELVPPTLDSLKKAKVLMKKYEDHPMDYADATLVVLAEDLKINNIMTFDRNDFSTYRIRKKNNFIILP
jgi:predicted nucleic acid-binding protein